MEQFALIRIGDERKFVRYYTRDGFHVFWLQGEPHFVKDAPDIAPETITDLGELVEPDKLPWLMRKGVERRHAQIRSTGLILRRFEQIGSGFIELPVGNITRGWASFWSEVHERSVTYDADGQPVPKIKIDGNDLVSVNALETDLKRLGFDAARSKGIIDVGVGVERVGHAEAFLRGNIVSFLLPSSESLESMVPYLAYGLFLGFELGSSTPLGDMYTSFNRAWVLLFITVGVGGWFAWRKMKN